MKKLSAIIVDDEAHARQALLSKLETYCLDIEVVFSSGQPTLVIDAIERIRPNIIFLDIDMPEMSGFELLRKVSNFTGEVIFVTAHDKYAIEAFKVFAIGYLLKPIDTGMLVDVVNRVVTHMNSNEQTGEISERLQELLYANINTKEKRKIAVPVVNGYLFLQLDKVYRCEASRQYTIIYHEEGKIVSSRNIGYFIDILVEHNFFASHKSHLINLKYVESYTQEGEIVLNDGVLVPLSRRRKAEFMRLFI